MADELVVERHGRVLVLSINRPRVRNAVNGATAKAIAAAVDLLDDDDGLSVGVITGEGDHFCSGMDLNAFLAGELPSIKGRGFAGLVQRPPAKPLIAAIEGYALAGGFEIALACDLIVASSAAKFGLPEVKRGLVPTGGGALHLHEQLPYHVAMELLLSGDFISAERAHHFGFVNKVTEPGTALQAALEVAERLAANGPLALEAIKAIVRRSPDWSSADADREQRLIANPVFTSNDAREGARAFAEKRAAVWTRS
jgi:enoyl-CoA hydratase